MILKNGKRIDGCTDTLPVGTVQPFLGLTPPLGYLVCQGQLISKVEYPELYNICKSIFGTETDTHFYLPDLRGKTIAGYDSNDTAMNTIGKLLGNKTHTHTSAAHTHTVAGHVHSTGNHTLTVAEMPSHTHNKETVTEVTSGAYAGRYMSGKTSADPNLVNNPVEYTGGNGAHNHGNTGSTSLTTDSTTPGATGSNSNFQPTVVMNWIVKAVMLIPEYFMVENTLNSTSTSNALSAAQGKVLNDSKFNMSGGVISGQTKVELSGVTGATEVPLWSNAQLLVGSIVTNGAITRCPSIGFVEYQNADGVLYMKDRALFWASSNNNMGHIPAANTGYEIVHNGNKYDVIGVNWTNGKEVRTLDSIDGKPIYKKYVEGNFNGTTNVTLATDVDKYLDAQITVLRADASQWHRANAHIMPTLGSAESPSHIDGVFQQGSTIKTYCTNTVFTTAAFRGFIYYTKL
jgi:microcystin-dependent protein